MAIPCYSNLLAIFITFFLLLARKVNSYTTNTYFFNYTNFNGGPKPLTLQGDAKIYRNGVLALTSGEDRHSQTGRALYPASVEIWDNNTGHVASFVTSFSFEPTNENTAGGLIFFIAPPDPQIPSNSSGGNLGVIDGNNAFNQFVGVEFDTFYWDGQWWDPNYVHIGIDVNSLISLKTARWHWFKYSLVKVNIIYDSPSKTLSVTVADNTTTHEVTTLSQVVDLKAVLPQRVSVGFSATKADPYRAVNQTIKIHSWSYTSTLITSIENNINNIASYA